MAMDRRHSSASPHNTRRQPFTQQQSQQQHSSQQHQQHQQQQPNAIPSSVVSFVKKMMVSKSSMSQSPSESGSSTPVSTPMSTSGTGSPYRHVSPPMPSSTSSSPIPPMGNHHATTKSGAFNSMHKLKQKVSAHSSRMMASLTASGPAISNLSAEQLTAHLTEEEKLIIKNVLLKEEQFRETNKGLNPVTGKPNENQDPGSQTPVGAERHLDRHNSIGHCRICRKRIANDENYYHVCSNCGQYVCDDCSSYSSRDDTKYWMCSFCRRRGTQPTIAGEFGLKRMSVSKMVKKPPSIEGAVKVRRPSLTDQQRHSMEALSSAQATSPKTRSRPSSPPERYAAHGLASDSECLSDRRSSSESQGVSLSQPCDSGFKSHDDLIMRPNKSFSMSDSSDEENSHGGHHHRRRSRKAKIQRQKRSLTDEREDQPSAVIPPNFTVHEVLRHVPSDPMNNMAQIHHPNGLPRRKSSSSDVSDFHCDDQSYTSGDSPYWRSPRESADSDMLGLPSYSFGQRRSIPSLQIDTVDSNHLTLRDCFARRSSTGRALPKVPDKEQARSMLDLPHSRKSSSHSLDLPIDQPRRASAPEGENIRIVIDDVDTSRQQPHVHTNAYERIILHRDDHETSSATRGFGLKIVGGKLNPEDGSMFAYVAKVVPGGSAAKMGVMEGDKVLEWNGRSMVNLSYEQVNYTIDSSGSSAELILERKYSPTGQHLVYQRRRLSSAQNSLDSNASQALSAGSNQSISGQSVGGQSRRRLPRVPGAGPGPGDDPESGHSAPSSAHSDRRSFDEAWNKQRASLRGRHSVAELEQDGQDQDLIQVPVDLSRLERRKSSSALQQVKLRRSCSLKSEKSSTTVSNESMCEDFDSHPLDIAGGGRLGEIKLGIVMTKGMLEIDVIAARRLPLNSNNQPPDAYVKFHLKDKKRGLLQKKKTKVVAGDCNPVWRQLVKYDANSVTNRSLLVSVWERQKGFEHNSPIGSVEVPIDQLQLHKLTIGWYKLLPAHGQFQDES